MNPTLSDIQNLRIADFDYPLPDERIARYPLADRDQCKLLVFNGESISHRHFSDLPVVLKPDTLLVMNNTRVINARMEFHKESGARIEIFLLEPLAPRDYAQAFQQKERCAWQCMVGNLKKWKEGFLTKRLNINGVEIAVRATRGEALPGNAYTISFEWDNPSVTFASIVEAGGNIPIPPYLNRDTEASDNTDYQTVYSRISGSVAAPTAGLHFTPELLQALRARGVETREVTLHVGAGTFQPVKSEEIGLHPMHTEVFEVDLDLVRSLRKALAAGHPVVAVGTTTVRTLESLPILGMKVMQGDHSMKIGQWEAYSDEALSLDTDKALAGLETFMEQSGIKSLQASTAIMIAPGFRWRIAGGLITNFHQPRSTLLLLVSSFLGGGKDWERVYEEALSADYRFLSYGDACFFYH